ncbi:39S ribosomal protein L17, mitochondrial [Phlebotomus papatasi]|uniref:39S ribosomal protein L17, mitochondrial n=1 Tax=Phlebotomus papatasi TaxID=29031 RepID=UPI00248410D0|nr:39S ribosomal protein L17, mitochondrial [Phlebotomus papatasi]
MNQADVSKLMSQLKFAVMPSHRRLRCPQGPEGRMLKLRKTVTALFKNERIELYYSRADEARGYAEQLINEAIRYGDCHKATMELADFWLLDKQCVHKLFKVFVPRYQNYNVSYTRMYKAPREYPGWYFKRAVLELRGNPFPPLVPDKMQNRNFIHNVLLDEAKRAYRQEKYAEIAQSLKVAENLSTSVAKDDAGSSSEDEVDRKK